jgi:toxin ParE1/3/4
VARFRVSNAAQNDIREIGLYTQKHWGKEQRHFYLNGLNERFNQLADNPEISPERADFTPPVRINHYQKHLIVYALEDKGLLILRILHENMDVSTHLSE